jgi:hypothetical protein
MKLNPEAIRHAYASLCCLYPFTKWKLPLPEEIDFQILHDTEILGSYMYDCGGDYEHTITISSARCGHYATMFSTLCHEVAHLSFYRCKGDKWAQHGKAFRTRCHLIANELGLDPLEL